MEVPGQLVPWHLRADHLEHPACCACSAGANRVAQGHLIAAHGEQLASDCRDLFRRAYEVQCLRPVDGSEPDVDAINACGLGLRERFGFPDPRCPAASPMAELDGAVLKIPDLAVEVDAAVDAPADPQTAPAAGEAAPTQAPR